MLTLGSLFDGIGTWQLAATFDGELILKPSSKNSCRPKFLYLNAVSPTRDWLTVEEVKSRGACVILNTGVAPSEEKESSLSQILQDDAPPKYSLSPRACEGILRRARAKNKTLPPELEQILIAQSTKITDKTAESNA